MNTKIYMWLDPVIMNHKKCTDKVYFDLIIPGNYYRKEFAELEKIIEGRGDILSIMDFADIDSNYDYGIMSVTNTVIAPAILQAKSPEETKKEADKIKVEKKINKIVVSKKDIPLTKKDIEIQDGGKINISLPALMVNDSIDFPKLWDIVSSKFTDKLKNGDSIILNDHNGLPIFEIQGGAFLNIGLADMGVYNNTVTAESSRFERDEAQIGGLFLRDDGSLDIGDIKRTFYMKIHTARLLKASLKNKLSLSDTTTKLLQSPKTTKN